MDIYSLVNERFRASGFDLQPHQVESLTLYMMELKRWNRSINLTGLKTDEALVRVLLLGSMAFSMAHPRQPGGKVMDLGSGAGAPGIPLKIITPGIDLTLVESRKKKAAFLSHLVRLLKLTDTRCLPVRAETLAGAAEMQHRFDLITSRAAGDLGGVVKASAPLLSEGGLLLVMKGTNYSSQLESAAETISRWGMKLEDVVSPSLGGERHHILVLRKEQGTTT